MTITAGDLARRLADLEPIGRTAAGTSRLAWTPESAAAEAWFRAQAEGAHLRVETDPAGNLWAVPDAPPPWWGVGSHLDSVRDGGRFDGALGVAAAFEAAARSVAPVAVVSFADEEGARFNTPTFGSRALVGRLDVDDVLARRDDDGVALADAMRAAGVDPEGLRRAPEALARLRGFLELHIDQSTELARHGAPAGVVGALASRLRLAVEATGRADHAGTTPRGQRGDAMLAVARVIVHADAAAAARAPMVATATRLLAEPNALTTVAARVRCWIDARAASSADLDAWERAVRDAAADAAGLGDVSVSCTVASRSEGIAFDPAVRHALRVALGDHGPELLCFAGHDAGILAERIPAGMVFVRNATGVSHAPAEHVELTDAAVAAEALRVALDALAAS